MKNVFFLFLSMMILFQVNAQDEEKDAPCPCCTHQGKLFNFLLGDWEITDTSGNQIGKSSIEPLNDSCLIMENWEWSDGSLSGSVIRYVDGTENAWRMLWLDSKGFTQEFKIEIENDKYVMLTDPIPDASGVGVTTVVTLEPNDEGSIDFIWKVSTLIESKLEAQEWKIVFEGFYVPVSDDKENEEPTPAKKNKKKK